MEQIKYQNSDKLPLSLVVEALEKETWLTEKALHILSVEDIGSTYTPVTAISALINHWLCERDLNCYINGKLVDDFTALTVLPVDGDYGKGVDALENWITIRKDELAALLKQRNLTVPAFLRPSVQVSKAPPPITPIRGNNYVPQKPKDERLPRWNKWRLMPEVKMWEAIALSLNVEPDKIKTSSTAWMGAEHPFDEGEEFNDRLAVLRANSGRANFPTPCTLNMGEWYSCGVRLNEFSSWALSVTEWGLPPELVAMAKTSEKQTGAPAETNTRPAAKGEAVPGTSPSGDGWIVKAREFAKEYLDRHKVQYLFPSQPDVCGYVEGKLRENNIYGSHGKPPSASYIARNAIQGEWWKINKR